MRLPEVRASATSRPMIVAAVKATAVTQSVVPRPPETARKIWE